MRRSILILLAALFWATSPRADEVVLANGDRVTGRIVRKTGDILTLETRFAGELKILWTQVRSVRTDGPIDILFRLDTETTRARLLPLINDWAELEGKERYVRLGDIMFINPTPDEAGTGTFYKGRATASLTGQSGNTEGERVYADFDLSARARDYRYNLNGKADRARTNEVETAASWLGQGNFDWFATQKRFHYFRASDERDRFRDIEHRITGGFGEGVQLIETDRSNVSLRGGLDYVTIRRFTQPHESYPAIGWGINASHKFGLWSMEAFHSQEGFWNMERTDSVTIRTRSGLRMPLFFRIVGSIQLNVDWDRRPPPPLKSTDSMLVIGLGIDW